MEKVKHYLELAIEWMKYNKWQVVLSVLLVAVLAFAFWYGGDSPDAHGWSVEKNTTELSTEYETQMEEISSAEMIESEVEESTTEAETEESAEAREESVEGSAEAETESIKNTGKESKAAEEKSTAAPKETTKAVETTAPPKKEVPTTEAPTTEAPTPAPTEPPTTEAPTPAPTEPPVQTSTCTISISCATALDHMDEPGAPTDMVPGDGWILRPVTVEFTEGESVFDVLQRVCQVNGIHMESEWTPMYNSAYIEGIHNIYEFDFGSGSGWMYKVNGWFPNYGCSRYEVKNGDEICWLYTCDLGSDIGGSNVLN